MSSAARSLNILMIASSVDRVARTASSNTTALVFIEIFASISMSHGYSHNLSRNIVDGAGKSGHGDAYATRNFFSQIQIPSARG